MAKQLRRPTKGMMLAVNAAIEGDKSTVDRLMDEYDLASSELERRIEARNGRKYQLDGSKKKRQLRSEKPPRARARSADLEVTIDGRTSVAKLFKLMDQAERTKAAAQQELKRRPPEEIEPVKKALGEIELLRRQQRKLEEKIRVAEGALG